MSKSNVELHDVRWVVGSKVEDTFDVLRRDWFGSPDGLHIDSYKKIKNVDGYEINLKNIDKEKMKNNKLFDRTKPKKNYGLLTSEVMSQIQCKKNMSLG